MKAVPKCLGLHPLLKTHLDDPVNWVSFIQESSMAIEEQKWWRDHLNLEHTFDDDFEA